MNNLKVILLSFIVTLMFCSPVAAASSKAPEWAVSEWINGGGVTLDEFKGKVVIVEFFQLWCPGCNSFSIPLMKEWSSTFRNEIASGDLMLLSIHTVFEGHSYHMQRCHDNMRKFQEYSCCSKRYNYG